MVATVGSISIDLQTNVARFADGFRRSATTVERESGRMARAARSVDTAFAGLKGFGAGAVGSLAGVFSLSAAIQTYVQNTIEAEEVTAQLAAAIASTGGAAGLSVKELQAMATGFQSVTTFGDEAIQSMQGVLLTFTKVGKDVFPAASEAVLDLSTRMGTDLKAAALQVGKALNDPIKGVTSLSRAGIQFSEEQKRLIANFQRTNNLAGAQAIILQELQAQFGGSARAARDTLGGALKALSNAWGDLFEITGPASDRMKTAVDQLVDRLNSQDFKNSVQLLGVYLFQALGSVTEQIKNAVDEFERLDKAINRFQGNQTLENFGNIIGPAMRQGEGTIRNGALKPLFDTLVEGATQSATEIKAQIQSIEAEIAELITRPDASEFELLNAEKLADDVAFMNTQLAEIEDAGVRTAQRVRGEFAQMFRAAEDASMEALAQYIKPGPSAVGGGYRPGAGPQRPGGSGSTMQRVVDPKTGVGITRPIQYEDDEIVDALDRGHALQERGNDLAADLISAFQSGLATTSDLFRAGIPYLYEDIRTGVHDGLISGFARDRERQQYSISTSSPAKDLDTEIERLRLTGGTVSGIAAEAIQKQIAALELQKFNLEKGLGGIGSGIGRFSYAGAFADGGSFTVPGGSSVGDKNLITLLANAGEKVTVEKAGQSSQPINVTVNLSGDMNDKTWRQRARELGETIERERNRS